MDHALMERMPGIMPPAYLEKDLSVEERARLLEAFKNAFMYVSMWNYTLALAVS